MPGNDSYTKLLIQSEAANGSTTMTDSSASAHSISNFGVTHNTSTAEFGNSSLYYYITNGAGGIYRYMSVPNNADFNFGTDDFTIDAWVNMIYFTNENSIVTCVGKWQFYIHRSYGLFFNDNDLGLQVSDWKSPATQGFVQNQWHHVALTREGNTFRIFRDGTLISSGSNSGAVGTSTTDLYVGRYQDTDWYFRGYMEEVRVSKGIARWTAPFTPPTSPYNSYARKVSGSVNDSARIITIDESNWTIIGNDVVSTGAYESWTTSGTNMVIARRETDGEVVVYGGVDPVTP